MSKIKFLLCLICITLLAGCATNWPKQLEKNLAHLDSKGLVLATVTTENKLDSTDPLLPFSFLICENGNDDYEKCRFGVDHLRALTENRKFYLTILEANPGNHFFYSVRGNVIGDILRPLFEAPILLDFQANKNEIVYIGNIHLVLRKKTSDSELEAGPVLPLIDQAVIAGATFDVEINDKYEQDIKEFEKVFTNLKGYNVVKRVLPSWNRPTAEEFQTKKTAFFFY